MLRPKQTKYRKFRKIRIKGVQGKEPKLNFGPYGLKSVEGGQISSRQIEAVRRVITRKTKRAGKVWIRIFPNTPVSSKPNEIRMGKGKGSVTKWVAVVKPGTLLYELSDVEEHVAKNALMSAAKKLSMRCAFVSRN